MHVLLADGCEASRSALRERLKAAGHTVSETDSAVSALLTMERDVRNIGAVIISESIPIIHGGRIYGRSEFGWSVLLSLKVSAPRARLLLVLETDDAITRSRAFAARIDCIVRGPGEVDAAAEWLAASPPAPKNTLLVTAGVALPL